MLDATNLPDKSFTKVNMSRTGTRMSKRHVTPEPYMTRMRALNKHIQQHNVSQILGDTQVNSSHTRRGSCDVEIDEKKEISANLTGLKKKFDETRETRYKKEKEINWMRSEIDKLKANEQFIKDDFDNSNIRYEELHDGVETQKLRIEEAIHRKNTYLHMFDRIKRDKITDQMKVRDLEELFGREASDLNQEETNARKARQFHLQTRLVFDDIIKQVELDERKRRESLVVFESSLSAKEQVERKREDRIKRTQDIAENAAAEIRDSNEKKWRELLMVHRFLAIFLKKKMDREMKTYEVVERAFQKIKASTGLADAKEIVNKFVRKEDTYSELLISIASYEKKIADLKKTNDVYRSKLHALNERNAPFEKQRTGKHTENQQLLDAYKELQARTETYKDAKLKIEKVHDWTIRNLLKLDKAQQMTKYNYYETYPKEKVVDAFLKVIEAVKGQLLTAKEGTVGQILDEIEFTKMEQIENGEFTAKNVRVNSSMIRAEKFKPTESSNSRINISRDGSEFDGIKKETPIEEEDEEDVNRYLNEQRLGIKAKRLEEMIRQKRIKDKEDDEREKERLRAR